MEENKIYRPLQDETSFVQLIQQCGNDRMIVNAARVSYANNLNLDDEVDERDYKLIRYLLKHRHGTPFEHNLITFRMTVPLYVIQEMLRHRIGTSFNQESQRYVEPSKLEEDVLKKFYVPKVFRKQDSNNKQSSFGEVEYQEDVKKDYIDGCVSQFERYERMIQQGVCREQARGVLPHCTYSSLYFTLNLRSLFHFLGLRLPSNAQWEIQQYAQCMLESSKEFWPHTYRAVKELNIFNYD